MVYSEISPKKILGLHQIEWVISRYALAGYKAHLSAKNAKNAKKNACVLTIKISALAILPAE
jgi:hypothetical protein